MRVLWRILLFPLQLVWAVLFLLALMLTWPVRFVRNRGRLSEPSFRFLDAHAEALSKLEGVAWAKVPSAIPPEAVHLFCIHHLLSQVENGGLWQFFYNADGDFAPEARDGFRAIGMDDAAEVIQQAMDKLGKRYPRQQDRRRKLVGPPEDRMDFYDLNTEIHRLAQGSVLAHMLGARPHYLDAANAYALRAEDDGNTRDA